MLEGAPGDDVVSAGGHDMSKHTKESRHSCEPLDAFSPEARAFLDALDGGSRHMQDELEALAPVQIDVLYQELRERSWPARTRARFLGALSEDPRPEVRMQALAALADEVELLPSDLVEDLLYVAACDEDATVRAEVPPLLGDWLSSLDEHSQAAVVDRWASARSAGTRYAIARALMRELSLPGAEEAIVRLAADAFAAIRMAAARAAGARYDEAPETYDGVLMDLFWDSDPRVRRAAASEVARPAIRSDPLFRPAIEARPSAFDRFDLSVA
jgi:hypothetical protein